MASYSFGYNPSTQSMLVADFNGDRRLDLAVVNPNTANIEVLLGNGDGTFESPIILSLGSSSYPFSAVVSDFNSDGHLDLAFTGYLTVNVGVVFGNGDGTFGPVMTYSGGAANLSTLLVAGDFNNDDHLDLAVKDYWELHTIGVLFGSGDGIFIVQTKFFLSNTCDSPSSFAVGDFDSDGQLDLALTQESYDHLCVLLGNGDGYFGQPIIFSTGDFSAPQSVTVADLNNDSSLDIVIANSRKNNVGVGLGNGNGTFQVQTTYFTGDHSWPNWVVTGDFNNDNQLDIAVSNWYTHNAGVFLGAGNGTFLEQTTVSTGSRSIPVSIATGDFNSDRKLDLVVIDSAQYNVIILLNICDCCVP
jgi:hypothetical protein